MKSLTSAIAQIVIILLLSGILGSILWPYSINSWLLFMGKDPVFPAWGGFLLGILPIFGQSVVAVAIVTWVLMMFLV